MSKTPTGHDYATALAAVAFLLAAHPELTVPNNIDVTLADWSKQPLVNIALTQGADLAESEDRLRPWAQLANDGAYTTTAHKPDTPEFWTHLGFHTVVFSGLRLSAYICHRHSKDPSEPAQPAQTALAAV
jgi:hypothetical protein